MYNYEYNALLSILRPKHFCQQRKNHQWYTSIITNKLYVDGYKNYNFPLRNYPIFQLFPFLSYCIETMMARVQTTINQ